jgi:hypothetical protein
MAPSTPTNERSTPAAASLPTPIRAGAFWAAVVLPFCALALLASGLSTTTGYIAFVSLVAVNIVALVAGHGYGEN